MDGLLPPPGNAQDRGFRRIVGLLVGLVVVPTALLLVIGILMLVLWRSPLNLVFGILVMALVLCLVTGSVIALVLLRREARLSALQTDFISKVSHELKTPLTSILMFAEMIDEEPSDPSEQQLCLDGIRRETSRLGKRIERLLEWGRMEVGQRSFHRASIDPPTLVERAARVFQGSAQGRDIHIELEISEPLPPVEGDFEALLDAMLNLLDNAAKYGSAAGSIVLGTRPTAKGVRFLVRDQGPGIPRREQRRIFQKFYRVDDRLSRAVQGTGLGLAIVEHVAQAHGGRVELFSEPGEGSTFSIVIPAKLKQKEGT